MAIKILNKSRRVGRPSESPSGRRAREHRQELDRIRSFLTERFEMEIVIAILDATIDELRSSGEPLDHGDEWLTGPLCNTPSQRAVFETAIRSMAKIGLPLESARDLYQRLPIGGMSYFMERTCPGLFE